MGDFDEFMRVGRVLSRELRIRPGALEEGSAIVRCAVGDEWIQETIQKYRRLKPSIREQDQPHRIAECFAMTSASQVIEVLELGAYLRTLATTPQIATVVAQLRSDYEHAFLQLATAYRFRKIGLQVETFEPATALGRAGDILCSDGGFRSVVECYCPAEPHADREYELQYLRTDLDRFEHNPVRIDIHARKPISAEARKRIQRFLRSLDLTNSGPWTLDDEAALVTISRLALDQDHGPCNASIQSLCGSASWIMQAFRADADDVRNMAVTSDYSKTPLSYLRVWMSRTPAQPRPDVQHIDLARRISRKLTQARTPDGLARLVIARVSGVEHLDGNARRLAASVQRELGRIHNHWNGVWLVNRRWMHTSRFMHHGIYVIGPNRPIMEERQFKALVDWERNADVLDDLGGAR